MKVKKKKKRKAKKKNVRPVVVMASRLSVLLVRLLSFSVPPPSETSCAPSTTTPTPLSLNCYSNRPYHGRLARGKCFLIISFLEIPWLIVISGPADSVCKHVHDNLVRLQPKLTLVRKRRRPYGIIP